MAAILWGRFRPNPVSDRVRLLAIELPPRQLAILREISARTDVGRIANRR
jgi:hypothetical protein